MASERITLTIPGPDGDREVGLSNPNRVIWPDLGITKHELAEYLLAVSGPFLAANGDRPVSLERFPEGVGGEPVRRERDERLAVPAEQGDGVARERPADGFEEAPVAVVRGQRRREVEGDRERFVEGGHVAKVTTALWSSQRSAL